LEAFFMPKACPRANRSNGSRCDHCACQQQCLLGRLDRELPAAWRGAVSEAPFRKGEVLQRQGDGVTGELRMVKLGLLVIQRGGARREGERPVGMAGCGQVLGLPALLAQPAELSFVAVTPGRLCRVALAPQCQGGAGLPVGVLRELAREQLQTGARLADWGRIARVRGVAAQLAGALLQLAELQRSTLVRLPSQAVLAALLATTRESVARALALLAREQALLRRDRWHCEIEREQLSAWVDGGRGRSVAAA